MVFLAVFPCLWLPWAAPDSEPRWYFPIQPLKCCLAVTLRVRGWREIWMLQPGLPHAEKLTKWKEPRVV